MGKVLIYDDEEPIVKQIKSSVRGLKKGLTPIVFTSLNSLRDYIYSEENWEGVKAVVFDLAQQKEQEQGIMDFEILEDIKWCYQNRRVPILIHSAYADQLEVLKSYPSVLLFKKGARSIRDVRNCLGLMEKTGFLDLFCEGPLLRDEVRQLSKSLNWGDDNVKNVLHQGFMQNFRNTNILDDLKSLSSAADVRREVFLKYLDPTIQELKKYK